MSRFKNKLGGVTGTGGEGNLIFVRPADLDRASFTGIVAEGEFVEAFPNKFDENKHDFKIVADTKFVIKGVDSKGAEYVREVAEGDTLVINGAGNLDYLMSRVSPGELCQINYLGKNEIESGKRKGTMAHTFQIAYGE